MPTRRGCAKNLTLEHEAIVILESLAASKRAQGHLLSNLLRQEERRRVEMREKRQQAPASEEDVPV